MSVLPTLFRRVYIKAPRPQCPKHGERDMVHRGRAYACTFGWTDVSATTECTYVSTPRVRVSRVEPNLDDFADVRTDSFGPVDGESL